MKEIILALEQKTNLAIPVSRHNKEGEWPLGNFISKLTYTCISKRKRPTAAEIPKFRRRKSSRSGKDTLGGLERSSFGSAKLREKATWR